MRRFLGFLNGKSCGRCIIIIAKNIEKIYELNFFPKIFFFILICTLNNLWNCCGWERDLFIISSGWRQFHRFFASFLIIFQISFSFVRFVALFQKENWMIEISQLVFYAHLIFQCGDTSEYYRYREIKSKWNLKKLGLKQI